MRFLKPLAVILIFLQFSLTGCAHNLVAGGSQKGKASWYGDEHQAMRTASGEKFDMNELTAAHRTLPFNSIVEVKSLSTGKSVRVRINDRGPFSKGRIIDVSKAAASQLGFLSKGTDRVEITVITLGAAKN
jgi:rare lipoprotein A